MAKLTKAQLQEKADHRKAIEGAYETLEEALGKAKSTFDEVWSDVETAQEAYNEALASAREFVEGIASDARDTHDGKSEKWQEGEAGQRSDEWIGEWENFDADEISLDAPEFPELDASAAETLDALPEEAG